MSAQSECALDVVVLGSRCFGAKEHETILRVAVEGPLSAALRIV
jgi:hypothetical protein